MYFIEREQRLSCRLPIVRGDHRVCIARATTIPRPDHLTSPTRVCDGQVIIIELSQAHQEKTQGAPDDRLYCDGHDISIYHSSILYG